MISDGERRVTTPAHNALLARVAALAQSDLAPQVHAIDQDGIYPEAFMRSLGAAGGYGAAVSGEDGGLDLGLATQIAVTDAVGAVCGATAFLTWCQSTCAWYLRHSANQSLRERYLPAITRGEQLAGTGMSNTMKHLCGIEPINLKAKRQDGGYLVNGTLPWVSNIGEDHVFGVSAALEDGGYVMFLAHGSMDGLKLGKCPAFSGMEGTRTFNCRFNNAFVSDDVVIAAPEAFQSYIQRIKPGFILGQLGIGFGVIEGCLQVITDAARTHGHVNGFLDDQAPDLGAHLAAARQRAAQLAAAADAGDAPVLDVLKLRAAASELSLSAANAALLHAGAKGYLMVHPAQRRLREAMFVAIVTPALKHLKREIHNLESSLPEAGRLVA